MFRTVKLRLVKSFGVAALTTVAAVVAGAPVATAAPSNVPVSELSVTIKHPGPPSDIGWITVDVGTTFDLEAIPSTDLPLQTLWEAQIEPGVGTVNTDLKRPKLNLTCESQGFMNMRVKVIDEAAREATNGLVIYCQNPLNAEIDPRPAAGAQGELSVKIKYPGPPHDYYGWISVEIGAPFDLEAIPSTDLPLQTQWEVKIPPGVGTVNTDLKRPKINLTCEFEGFMEVSVKVIDEAAREATDGLVINCQKPLKAEIEPRPAVPGQREFVALGTTIEFRSDSYGLFDFESEWRTTGVRGVAGYGQGFSRTFDKVGNYGVELTNVSSIGRSSMWVGYTVIDSPTVSVSPAPKPGENLRVAAGSSVTFSGAGSQSPGGGSLAYEWRTTGVRGIAGREVTFARKFETVGNYAVRLAVINELGERVEQRVGISVFKSEPPTVSVWPAPDDPNARMTVQLGDRVNFQSLASDPDGGPLTYEWRTTGVPRLVGDEPTYVRAFDEVGQFGVELTVIDDEGQRAKKWVGINVVPWPS